jgi:hypothetical protein
MIDGYKCEKDGPLLSNFVNIEFRPEVNEGDLVIENYSLQYLWTELVAQLEVFRADDAVDISNDLDHFCLSKSNAIMSAVSTQYLRLLMLMRVPLAVIDEWYRNLPWQKSVGGCMKKGFLDSHFLTEPVLSVILFFYRLSKVSSDFLLVYWLSIL